MNYFIRIITFTLLGSLQLQADPSVNLQVPDTVAWTGERIPFFIELRAEGSFVGAASFDLPETPNSVVIKVGNPVIGSVTEGGVDFFTQRHEFALFSQAEGRVGIPPVPVRFSHRKGFTGPSFEASLKTEAAMLEVRRPPGSEGLGFLVTTESLAIKESWDPVPGSLKTGAVLKRTIVQSAEGLTGMALAPANLQAPDGIRVYPGDPEVSDNTERGRFTGERRDTITYLVREPGLHTLPALRYLWWDPKTEQLLSKTLPEVIFEATALPADAKVGEHGAPRRKWWWALVISLTGALLAWQRSRLGALLSRLWKKLYPTEHVAARKLLRACRRHDPSAAQAAWEEWRIIQGCSIEPSPELRAALLGMQRQIFGPEPDNSWIGGELAKVFKSHRAKGGAVTSIRKTAILPLLNASRLDQVPSHEAHLTNHQP